MATETVKTLKKVINVTVIPDIKTKTEIYQKHAKILMSVKMSTNIAKMESALMEKEIIFVTASKGSQMKEVEQEKIISTLLVFQVNIIIHKILYIDTVSEILYTVYNIQMYRSANHN